MFLVHAVYLGVSLIHQTLTWTAGSLTRCNCDLFASSYTFTQGTSVCSLYKGLVITLVQFICTSARLKKEVLTFHSLLATWRRGLRKRRRRRWSCWPLWPQPWPGRIYLSLGAETHAHTLYTSRLATGSPENCQNNSWRKSQKEKGGGGRQQIHMTENTKHLDNQKAVWTGTVLNYSKQTN